MKTVSKTKTQQQKSIQKVIEETTSIYTQAIEAGGQPNLDYAGFACEVALNRFRQALEDPTMESEDLEALLRRARVEVRDFLNETGQRRNGFSQWQEKPCKWAYLMAHYVARTANLSRRVS